MHTHVHEHPPYPTRVVYRRVSSLRGIRTHNIAACAAKPLDPIFAPPSSAAGESFESQDVAQSGKVSLPQSGEKELGGHDQQGARSIAGPCPSLTSLKARRRRPVPKVSRTPRLGSDAKRLVLIAKNVGSSPDPLTPAAQVTPDSVELHRDITLAHSPSPKQFECPWSQVR